MKKMVLFLLFCFSFIFVQAQENFVTSIIIPCCAKHSIHLYQLIKMYEQQTELPDEIVVSISESNRIKGNVLEALNNELWSFPVTIITSKQKLYAGQNRNIACQRAKGNVLICQDADDIPHPQRVEIIKYFFSNYQIDHLMHRWVTIKKDFDAFVNKSIQIPEIEFIFPQNFQQAWNFGCITNGNVAISRDAFDMIKWSSKPRGQDVQFNAAVYSQFPNRIVISAPLLGYRNFLSSHRKSSMKMYEMRIFSES